MASEIHSRIVHGYGVVVARIGHISAVGTITVEGGLGQARNKDVGSGIAGIRKWVSGGTRPLSLCAGSDEE
jgi:hypothetical protein